MIPTFVFISMTILCVSTIMGLFTNAIIITVNVVDKIKGKSISASDLILVTMGVSNVIFQLIMLANDFCSLLDSNLYFSKEVYIIFSVVLNASIFSSFWFTVCLSINYYFQIVIFTHPFLIRLKLAVFRFIPQLLMASVFVSLGTCIPVIWNIIVYDNDFNMTINQTAEISLPELNLVYMVISTLISCSLPLVLVGIANGLIIKSLVTHTHKSDRNEKGDLSARAEGRIRAARTLSCLLFIYISFYVSEILMFTDVFPPSSPGLCACLIVIYSYPPAQSIVLIFGSPKLKQAAVNIMRRMGGFKEEKSKTATVSFIKFNIKKVVPPPAT
ncbi:taste receptor type 2 member 40-like [Pseudophryne corroboree]|uniref:taste receptor type 2 member 40-like n=1 Tax=Pseudophryne corroboree TaxID=495146 RepID=UPI00308165B2